MMGVRDDKWNYMYSLLLEYRKENNNKLPTSYEKYRNENLGSWLHIQRMKMTNGVLREDGTLVYKRMTLNVNQQNKLKDIGIVLNCYDTNWERNYQLLNLYIKKYKTYPKRDTIYEGVYLGKWANEQRVIYNLGEKDDDDNIRYKGKLLLKEQWVKLEQMGFIFDAWESKWLKNFNLLKEYVLMFDSFPKDREKYKNTNLGAWVNVQRRIYANGELQSDGSIVFKGLTLSKEHISLLESISFPWFVKDKYYSKREIVNTGQMEGTRRFLLYKYRNLLELKKDANAITLMIEENMLRR